MFHNQINYYCLLVNYYLNQLSNSYLMVNSRILLAFRSHFFYSQLTKVFTNINFLTKLIVKWTLLIVNELGKIVIIEGKVVSFSLKCRSCLSPWRVISSCTSLISLMLLINFSGELNYSCCSNLKRRLGCSFSYSLSFSWIYFLRCFDRFRLVVNFEALNFRCFRVVAFIRISKVGVGEEVVRVFSFGVVSISSLQGCRLFGFKVQFLGFGRWISHCWSLSCVEHTAFIVRYHGLSSFVRWRCFIILGEIHFHFLNQFFWIVNY